MTDVPAGCRVCGGAFFETPLLHYEDMPCAAQAFPDAASLANDCGADLEIRQCIQCGLVQLAGAPVPYYRDVIRAAAISAEMREFREQQFTAFVKRFHLEGKKAIEIGCGRGEYLSILARLPVQAYGLEHAPASVEHCRKAGLRAAEGFLDSGAEPLADAPFDAFLILNFLEHLPGPNASLRAMAGSLGPDGVGLVEVPNFDMILGKNLFSEFIADHLLYFTAATLAATLARNGFEVLDCREVWHGYILSAEVRKRRAYDLTGFRERQTHLAAEIDAYLGRFGPRQVAVWGAGHQALAVLSLAKLGGRVRYVVDSAPFKQGRYTPASHLPIVPPEALRTDPVEAVLIMTAGYSGEVARTVRAMFDGALPFAIVRDFGLEEASTAPGSGT